MPYLRLGAPSRPYSNCQMTSSALWRPWDKDLRTSVDDRRVLTEDFRHSANEALRALARCDVPVGAEASHDGVMRHLRDALNASNRVADLIATEADIDWRRERARARRHGS
jgi:hypothetical protein